MLQRAAHVAQQLMQPAVTIFHPLGDVASQMTNSTEEVETREPSSIEDLHQDIRRDVR